MYSDFDELTANTVYARRMPAQTKSKSGYAPRHERRRAKPGELCNGAHRRRNKRSGL